MPTGIVELPQSLEISHADNEFAQYFAQPDGLCLAAHVWLAQSDPAYRAAAPESVIHA
ncbi:hypothetical protein [Pandoraea sputorum]|uniref:hypothetical protein n=1 Tax=Pandoraea sputorum TaxID=93222 RepID=UPI00177F6C39|nr:hypothetical protein [Pandoraea sputorum]